ncbi:MAG: class I SAM-dependent methyltransferase [bacterium]
MAKANPSFYQKRVFEETNLWGKRYGRVLDIGCGEGREARLLASWGNKVTAVDVAKSKEWGQAPTGVIFEIGNGEQLKFKDRSFDLVFSKDALHHTKNPKNMLLEAGRVCKKGGKVVFVEANRYNPISFLHMTHYLGHNHFTQKSFKQMVKPIFPKSQLGSFEAHYYPFLPPALLSFLAKVEQQVSKLPFLGRWFSYNYFTASV